MKKLLLTSLIVFRCLLLHSQNIENPSFDSVYIGGIDRMHAWITSDSWSVYPNDTVPPLYPDSHYVSVGLQFHELLYSAQLEYNGAFDGAYAIKLVADTGRVDMSGNPFKGFVVNGDHFYTNSNGYIDFAKGGTPFAYRPFKMTGHYKFEDNSASLSNYPEAIVLLKKYNVATQSSDTIAFAVASMQFIPTSNWIAFEMPLTYLSSQMPDSIVVALLSPPLGHLSSFSVDSLGFDFNFPSKISENNGDRQNYFFFNSSEEKIIFKENNVIATAKIFSSNGQLVKLLNQPYGTYDLSELPVDVYVIAIQFKDSEIRSFKLVKQKN